MTKKETFEAAVANHVRKQIAAGAKELGGMHQVINNCILILDEHYSSSDVRRQYRDHQAFERNFESKVAEISIKYVDLDHNMQPTFEVEVCPKETPSNELNITSIYMLVSNEMFSTEWLWTEPDDVDSNNPEWDTWTELFMGSSTLRIAEY